MLQSLRLRSGFSGSSCWQANETHAKKQNHISLHVNQHVNRRFQALIAACARQLSLKQELAIFAL